jgi:hypothetical protein
MKRGRRARSITTTPQLENMIHVEAMKDDSGVGGRNMEKMITTSQRRTDLSKNIKLQARDQK